MTKKESNDESAGADSLLFTLYVTLVIIIISSAVLLLKVVQGATNKHSRVLSSIFVQYDYTNADLSKQQEYNRKNGTY